MQNIKQVIINELITLELAEAQAHTLAEKITPMLNTLSPEDCWKQIYEKILTPQTPPYPFAIHEYLYKIVYPNWREQPAPAWFPNKNLIEQSNITQFMHANNISDKEYKILHQWSTQNYPEFWQKTISVLNIHLDKPYKKIVDLSGGIESPKWLAGGKLNICKSCFQANPNDIAILYKKSSSGSSEYDKHDKNYKNDKIEKITYHELNELSDRIAIQLLKILKKGDRVAIDMPMTPNAVAIYLGIVKAGCIVVSIADSFAANEIAVRLKISEVKIIFCQDFILRDNKKIPLYERVSNAVKILNKEEVLNRTKEQKINTNKVMPTIIVLPAEEKITIPLREQDLDWNKFIPLENSADIPSETSPFPYPIECDPEDYINILFSSGTTGDPKAIPWTQTTPIKCAADAYFHHNIKPGDIFCWPSNLGWMMGPWLIFASFLNKATMALYEGAPNNRDFGQFIQDAKVNLLGVVPTFVKTWRNTQCMEGLDWSAIKLFTSTGESSNIEDMLYLKYLANYRPIIEYCGGTEIGGAYITSTLTHPSAPAACTTAALGLDFVLIDEKENLTDTGEVALIPPSIGLSTKLLNNDHHAVYYSGVPKLPDGRTLRRHGDQAKRYPNGYYRLQGRVDDTMKLGGIKVSSAEIEQILNKVPFVYETAAIAVEPESGGPSQLVVYVVLDSNFKPGLELMSFKKQLSEEMQDVIKKQLNPLFKIYDVVVIKELPRTASNKIMHRTLRDQYR